MMKKVQIFKVEMSNINFKGLKTRHLYCKLHLKNIWWFYEIKKYIYKWISDLDLDLNEIQKLGTYLNESITLKYTLSLVECNAD